uniref:Uncharacterized protein n=1 Tax=Anguilla anguilla TaxID=7936 RepID=A0A0E9T7S1_ANGAN
MDDRRKPTVMKDS